MNGRVGGTVTETWTRTGMVPVDVTVKANGELPAAELMMSRAVYVTVSRDSARLAAANPAAERADVDVLAEL